MTDPLKGTPLEAFELPEGVVGFGAAELAYVLARHDGPAALKTREVLMLDPRQTSDGIRLAGASSLVARGWLVEGDTDAGDTKSYAALLEYATGQSYRWSRIGLVDPTTKDVDFVVLLESDTVVALLQPRIYASWFVRFGEPDTDPAPASSSRCRRSRARRPSPSARRAPATRRSPTCPARAPAPVVSSTPQGSRPPSPSSTCSRRPSDRAEPRTDPRGMPLGVLPTYLTPAGGQVMA